MADQELSAPPDSLSIRIVEAIANREGVDPTDLREPLYAAIDPEALEGLLGSGDVSVSFTFHGYEITARGRDLEIESR